MQDTCTRVLVATSDIRSRKALEHNLNKWGYETVSVTDGNEMLHILRQKDPPPLFMLDRSMSYINGTDVCKNIRAPNFKKRLYIILLVAGITEDDIAYNLGSIVDDYIKIPFSNEEVHTRIKIGVRSIEMQNALSAHISDLHKAASRIKRLSGLLPICSHCKKIRDDRGYWNELEKYIIEHSDAEFSHAICPDCLNKFYPDVINEHY